MQQRMGEVPLSQLLLDQVEFANVIVLNKTDLVSDATQLAYIRELVHRLNPTAKVLESQHGRIKPQEIINTHLFNIDEAQTTTKWVQELQKPFHASETEEYNIQSTAFIARRPFHPQRILDLINTNESS
jgi:G3E family GTPase